VMKQLDQEQLYQFFRDHPEKPWHVQDIQKRLKIDDRAELRGELNALTEAGRLVRTRRRTYGLPQEMNLILGRLQVTAGGYGFVIPDREGEKDLFIPADSLHGAWDGDTMPGAMPSCAPIHPGCASASCSSPRRSVRWKRVLAWWLRWPGQRVRASKSRSARWQRSWVLATIPSLRRAR